MKMISLLIVSFCLTLSISCIKEKTGHSKTIYKNSTGHKIKITPYLGGAVDVLNSRVLLPQSETTVYEINVRDKTIDPSFGLLLQPYDSVVVSYDDSVKIPHIKFNLSYTSLHRVLFSSPRSISNEANYKKEITNETKYSLSGYFLYEFVEQDYLDAKN